MVEERAHDSHPSRLEQLVVVYQGGIDGAPSLMEVAKVAILRSHHRIFIEDEIK